MLKLQYWNTILGDAKVCVDKKVDFALRGSKHKEGMLPMPGLPCLVLHSRMFILLRRPSFIIPVNISNAVTSRLFNDVICTIDTKNTFF